MRPGTAARTIVALVAVAAVAACADDVAPPSGDPVGTAPATAGPRGETPPAPAVAPAAQRYVDAVNAADLDALVAAFAPEAVVVDVSRRIRGHEAIRTWADREVIGGSLRVLESTPMDGGVDLLVHWAPEGSAGFRAHYRFTIGGDVITGADLQYA